MSSPPSSSRQWPTGGVADDAEVVADTVALTPEESVGLVVAELERRGLVHATAPVSS